MSLTLYAAPMSSATPVVCALTELDIPCEIVMLDLKAGDQKKPDYLALNPNGVVPTLVVDARRCSRRSRFCNGSATATASSAAFGLPPTRRSGWSP